MLSSTLSLPHVDARFVAEASAELTAAPPEEILRWAYENFDDQFVIASSMAEAVLVDMAARIRPGAPVLFLDTGHHFAETLATRDAVAARYDVELHTVGAERPLPAQEAELGPRLFDRDPDMCCALRKVAPLDAALAPYAAWASGLRRAEAGTRAAAPVVGRDVRRGKLKLNPLAAWTQADVDSYVERHQVIVNPLLSRGYRSIGCAPCTRPVGPGEDPRAGRWAGLDKTECGIHK